MIQNCQKMIASLALEYEKILESLKERGFIVISEARKQSPEIEPYAAKVAAQVKQLLNAGVPPKNITVLGASQGAWIAMLVSTYAANRDLNFVSSRLALVTMDS